MGVVEDYSRAKIVSSSYLSSGYDDSYDGAVFGSRVFDISGRIVGRALGWHPVFGRLGHMIRRHPRQPRPTLERDHFTRRRFG